MRTESIASRTAAVGRTGRRGAALLAACLGISSAAALAQETWDAAPINYTTAAEDNPVARLVARVAAGEAALSYESPQGYLKSLLRELNVSEQSQTLVFSKTSLQRHRIAPRTPRALYFNDDVYVGFCQGGEVLELSCADPQLGTVFYTLDQRADGPPLFARQGESCLICHGSSQTDDAPGHLVRSVYVNPSGLPIFASGTHRIDHTSPLEIRFGGWYVTGSAGRQKHLGNLISRDEQPPERIDNSAGLNVTDLSDRFRTGDYLSPHSDLVALLVLAHQAKAHNLLTRANFETRQALHYQAALNRELNQSPDHVWDSTVSRIRSACEPLVQYLLFSGEPRLREPVAGTSQFTAEFPLRGPRDAQGRSLRDFDLQTRLFRYPCSYLVYTPSFAALPEAAKEYVFRRLGEVLRGADQSSAFAHLSAADRQAILEILRDTLPGVPADWATAG